MKKIFKILFTTDFSKNSKTAFKYTLNLIRDRPVVLEIMHVVEPIYELVTVPMIDNINIKTSIGESVLKMKSFINEAIVESDIPFNEISNKYQTNIEIGRTVNTINRIVNRDKIDLLIIGGKGASNDETVSMGNIGEGLIKKVNCDVLAIPPNFQYKEIEAVVFASNFIYTDPFHIWKAKKILNIKNSSKINCVHILNKGDDGTLRTKMEELKSYALESLPGSNISFEIVNNNKVEETLLNFISIKKADILIMVKTKKNFVDKILNRSTTKNIINITKYPILILND